MLNNYFKCLIYCLNFSLCLETQTKGATDRPEIARRSRSWRLCKKPSKPAPYVGLSLQHGHVQYVRASWLFPTCNWLLPTPPLPSTSLYTPLQPTPLYSKLRSWSIQSMAKSTLQLSFDLMTVCPHVRFLFRLHLHLHLRLRLRLHLHFHRAFHFVSPAKRVKSRVSSGNLWISLNDCIRRARKESSISAMK